MNFYIVVGRIIRYVIAAVVLISVISYVQDSLLDAKIVEIAKKIETEFSFQIDDIDLKLALNDSTFVMKFDA